MALVSPDIWMDKECLTMLVFSGDLGKEARALLEEGGELIHSMPIVISMQ